MCVCARAVRVCECEMRIAAERQPGSNRVYKLCFLRNVYSLSNLCTSFVRVLAVFGLGQTFCREKNQIFDK